MNVDIRDAQFEDIPILGPKLRQADKREVYLASGLTPEEGLRTSLEASQHGKSAAWTAFVDGVPEVMFGVAEAGPQWPGIGSPWMLSSDAIYRKRKSFWFLSQGAVDLMHETFPVLTNWVHAPNVAAQQWLNRLGFIAEDYDPYFGKGRQPFLQFTSRREQGDTCVTQ